MQEESKTIEIVFSERGDSWIGEAQLAPNQTLREWLISKGYEKFVVSGLDADNCDAIKDGMSVRVKIYR